MRYTNIEKHAQFRLDPNHYTITLLEEGRRLGLINQADLDSIQAEIMLILAELIIKYNHGESSSLKTETAQRILMSIFYALDACLRSFSHPEDALEGLINGSVRETYALGLDRVETCMMETRQLYQEIVNNKIIVQIEAYNSTIDEALPDFFKKYDALYSAQDTMASMDYPLLFDDMRRQGIFYIKQYLEKLQIETQFCSFFSPEDIDLILLNYGRVYHIDYREALINVFEILLTNSIFSVLSGNSARELRISEYQYELLREKLIGLDHAHCSLLISAAIEKVLSEMPIDQPQLRNYIENFKSILIPRFLNALEHDSLANVIILDLKSRPPEIIFDEGKCLNDDSFRLVFDQIMECTATAGKISIINASIHALGDYIDILEADCLFADEYAVLFSTLGDMELSVLAKIVFLEELRSHPQSFSVQKLPLEALEMQWQVEYANYLQGLSQQRLISIDNHIKSSSLTGSWAYLE